MRAVLIFLLFFVAQPLAAAEVVIGSKKFTESVILGEVARQIAALEGHDARHRREIGGSRILFDALSSGEIDLYPEYTGTLIYELLASEELSGAARLEAALAARGLAMTPPLGFNNTYAIGMRQDRAAALGIETTSDLADHPALALGFSNEFMEREDGWPALRRAYGLGHENVRGLDHDLAYRGLAEGALDAIDVYTTDAEIAEYGLVTLADDRGHFPTYEPVFLYRRDLEERAPELIAALSALSGEIDNAEMSALNHGAKIGGASEAQVAANFVRDVRGEAAAVDEPDIVDRLTRRTLEHLLLVAISLGAAILIAIPLGVWAERQPRVGAVVLAATGLLQTVPSLAMFVFMIPLLGIGAAPTIAALFLYSLLPIVRNTHAGLVGIAGPLRTSAEVLGLRSWSKLRRIELPLALPAILAGIKTAAVINVGIATLGALIGAGGYGQPILTGIRRNELGLIFEGAVPAALMALAAQFLFDWVEHHLVPRGLRS